MNRKIATIAIIVAFVGGMFFAGVPVEAKKGGGGSVIDEVLAAISALDVRVSQNESDISGHETRITTLENAGTPNLEVQSFSETIIVPFGTPTTEVEISCPAGAILWKSVSDVGVTATSVVDKMGSPRASTSEPTTSFVLKYSHNGQQTSDGSITAKWNCLVIIP